MLNPEFKAKWLEALRSGKYKQGLNLLRKGDEFCCMGVACDLIDPSGWKKTPGHFKWRDVPSFIMPIKALNIASKACRNLANLNDIEEASFTKIADYIEENL